MNDYRLIVDNLVEKRVLSQCENPLRFFGFRRDTVIYVVCALFPVEIMPLSECIVELDNQQEILESILHNIRYTCMSLRNLMMKEFVYVYGRNCHSVIDIRIRTSTGKLIDSAESTLSSSPYFFATGMLHSDACVDVVDRSKFPNHVVETCGIFQRDSPVSDALALLSTEADGRLHVSRKPEIVCPVLCEDVAKVNFGIPRILDGSSRLDLIRNIHYDVNTSPEQIGSSYRVCLDGYDFYFYGCDGFDDHGWGCAYRSIQTIASWWYSRSPTIPEIQAILGTEFINSKSWVGCLECVTVFANDPLIECQILHARDMQDLAIILNATVWEHFLHTGSPVMIGAGSYAYTIVGISRNGYLLILDPHTSNPKTSTKWNKISTFFTKKLWSAGFINLCLTRPTKPYTKANTFTVKTLKSQVK